jgi:hypothetical protein
LVDLHTVDAVSLPDSREELCPLGAEDAVLAGGSWLFSEPQPHLLQSVQAAYADVVMNPRQCRGQVEGVAQAIGSPLYEEMHSGPDGSVLTQTLGNYDIPQFADTYDDLGPRSAKSMSESPYNPVAPALANAIARGYISCL